jgi:hypothetical protein
VPFRAKDSLTLQSEFSYSNVVIVLTCFSYYYGGLEYNNLFFAFKHLVKFNQADIEYGDWVWDTPDLPAGFQSLVRINLKDRFLYTNKIFPHLWQTKAVVDYFLFCIIFPKEMKKFLHKLSVLG